MEKEFDYNEFLSALEIVFKMVCPFVKITNKSCYVDENDDETRQPIYVLNGEDVITKKYCTLSYNTTLTDDADGAYICLHIDRNVFSLPFYSFNWAYIKSIVKSNKRKQKETYNVLYDYQVDGERGDCEILASCDNIADARRVIQIEKYRIYNEYGNKKDEIICENNVFDQFTCQINNWETFYDLKIVKKVINNI